MGWVVTVDFSRELNGDWFRRASAHSDCDRALVACYAADGSGCVAERVVEVSVVLSQNLPGAPDLRYYALKAARELCRYYVLARSFGVEPHVPRLVGEWVIHMPDGDVDLKQQDLAEQVLR